MRGGEERVPTRPAAPLKQTSEVIASGWSGPTLTAASLRQPAERNAGVGIVAGRRDGDEGARGPHLDEWIDIRRSRVSELDAMQGIMTSLDLLEFEALDAEHEPRGTVIAEVIGHAIDNSSSLSVIHIYPLAASISGILDWAFMNSRHGLKRA